jgi:hypothetical protein
MRIRWLRWAIAIVGLAAVAAIWLGLEELGVVNLIHSSHLHEGTVKVDYRRPPRADSRIIEATAESDGYCLGNQRKPEVERWTAEPDGDSVHLTAWVREFEEPHDFCAGLGYSAPVRIELSEPLGPRGVTAVGKCGECTLWPSEAQFDCLRHLQRPSIRKAQRSLADARDREDLSNQGIQTVINLEAKVDPACGVHIGPARFEPYR